MVLDDVYYLTVCFALNLCSGTSLDFCSFAILSWYSSLVYCTSVYYWQVRYQMSGSYSQF